MNANRCEWQRTCRDEPSCAMADTQPPSRNIPYFFLDSRSFASIRGSLLFLVCLLGCATSVHAAEPPHTIIFFGDSLTAGYGLDNPTSESYPALIQEKITASHLNWRVVNAGLSGE